MRAVIIGTDGVGKSTLAASAPEPIFIPTEDGADEIGVSRFPLCDVWQDVLDELGALIADDHSFRTAVVDSIDWAERLIHRQVAARNLVPAISDISYGRGYRQAGELLREMLEGLDLLRDQKSMTIVLLAHSKIRRFEDPNADPYDRYVPDMHDSAASLVCEWADLVGFMNYEISMKAADAGFGRRTIRGIGSGVRLLHVEERPGFIAKNRYRLTAPIVIPRENGWGALEAALQNATTHRQ
jgi:hypothetical protein